MSHVKRRSPRYPGRMIKQKNPRKKISKKVRNALLLIFVVIIIVFSAVAVSLIFRLA